MLSRKDLILLASHSATGTVTALPSAWYRWRGDSFDRAGFEANVGVPSLEDHHRTDRVRHGHACQKALNVQVVPDPTALKIGKLRFAFLQAAEQLQQVFFRAVEHRD
jgi:hypothetical protein